MYPRLYHKRFRVCLCAGILLAALLMRLAASPEAAKVLLRKVQSLLTDSRVPEAIIFLQAGVTVNAQASPRETQTAGTQVTQIEETSQPQTQILTPPQPAQSQPAQSLLVFAEQEAGAIGFRGNCSYQVDKNALLLAPLAWKTPEQGPQVLIVHTHTSEAYTPSQGWEYQASGNYRTLDDTRNVLAVGEELTVALEQLGVDVIHDTSYHDQPSYDNAYADSKAAIEAYLEEYPGIVMVLDLHRDAAEDENGNQICETVELNGQTCAQLMLVVGTDEGGLTHPDWQENLSCALKLQALTNRTAPGLFKRLSLRTERFNQNQRQASLLIEVGGAGNTLPQALAAVRLLAQPIAALLTAQKPG